jgi:ABC-type Co2+ transport system permease subunit
MIINIIGTKEVIVLITPLAYKITGLVVLIVGALFFLRDLGVNYIGSTSGWTIIIVLVGTGLLAGDFKLNQLKAAKKK